jgi:hypothetical protein
MAAASQAEAQDILKREVHQALAELHADGQGAVKGKNE